MGRGYLAERPMAAFMFESLDISAWLLDTRDTYSLSAAHYGQAFRCIDIMGKATQKGGKHAR